MKKLLSSKRNIIIAAVAVVAVVVAVVLIVGGGKKKQKTYRTIAVHEAEGATLITTDGKENGEAYVGRHLYSGDDARVQAAAGLTLVLDNDKYVYAEENTHFWLSATGKEGKTKTAIYVENGDSLHYLQEKLGADEKYEVTSPAATMAVRGTVFRVYAYVQDGYEYTLLEVYQGVVEVSLKTTTGEYNGVVRSFSAGESALMRADDEISEFLEPGSSDGLREIEYRKVPKSVAYHLGEVIDQGEVLSITKELLYDYVDIIDHEYEEELVSAATCTEDGLMHQICHICGQEGEDVVVPMIAHANTEWVVTIEGSCTEQGERQEICNDCGEILNTEILEAVHDYGDWETVAEATCVKDGKQKHVCQVCGNEETKVIAKTGHEYGDWTTTDPTCTKDGKSVRVCAICNKSENKTLAATGHSYGAWATTKEATCIAEGVQERTCSVCNHTETQTLAKLEHNMGDWVIKQASTCKVYGSAERSCRACGYSEQKSLDLAAHTYDDTWYPGPQTVCENDTYMFRFCLVCRHEDRDIISYRIGHSFVCSHGPSVAGVAGVECVQTCTNMLCTYYDSTTVNFGENCPYCGLPASF